MRIHLIKNKNQPWRKFLLLIALFALYFLYLIYEYGIQDGGLVTLLTWSFFVLCTPVADAGFLLDFPFSRKKCQIRVCAGEWPASVACRRGVGPAPPPRAPEFVIFCLFTAMDSQSTVERSVSSEHAQGSYRLAHPRLRVFWGVWGC